MPCTSGCRTQNHQSWGECMRAKNLRIAYTASAKGLDLSAQKADDRELAMYESAVRQGIQPATTRMPDIQLAMEASESLGRPWDAAKEHLVSPAEADAIMRDIDNL